MPQYLFNKAHLEKLIRKAPKDTNVIGIYVKYLKTGKGLTPKVEAKAAKFDTLTGEIFTTADKQIKTKTAKASADRANRTIPESPVATGSPVCPNPPGCTETITAILDL